MQKRLIGFTGPAGSGKSSAASILAMNGWELVSFAYPIKLVVAAGMQISEFELEQRKRNGDQEIRRWLRVIGDHGRSLDRNAYIYAASLRVSGALGRNLPVVIDDVRLPIEASWIRDVGGRVVHVQRAGTDYSREHVTECGVRFDPADAVLTNPGTVRELMAEVNHLMGALR